MYTRAVYKAQRASYLRHITKIPSHTVTLNTIIAVAFVSVSLSNSTGANISATHCHTAIKQTLTFSSSWQWRCTEAQWFPSEDHTERLLLLNQFRSRFDEIIFIIN